VAEPASLCLPERHLRPVPGPHRSHLHFSLARGSIYRSTGRVNAREPHHLGRRWCMARFATSTNSPAQLLALATARPAADSPASRLNPTGACFASSRAYSFGMDAIMITQSRRRREPLPASAVHELCGRNLRHS
jgi:hypothetical protein